MTSRAVYAVALVAVLCAVGTAAAKPSLMDLLDGKFELVEPVVRTEVNGRTETRLPKDGHFKGVHPRSMTVKFSAFSKEFELEFEMKTDLFAPDYEVVYMGIDEQERRERFPRQINPLNHCFYRAKVVGDESGFAAFSTCRGIRGFVVGHGMSLGVEPTWRHGIQARDSRDHLVFSLADSAPKIEGHFCGVDDAFIEADDARHAHKEDPAMGLFKALTGDAPARRQVTATGDKIVEYMVVNDFERYQDLGADVELESTDIVNIVNELYLNAEFEPNVVVIFTRHIVWASSDPYTPQASGGSEVSSSDLLNKFNSWSGDPSQAPEHDNHALFSGYDFDGSTLGLAGVCSMCTGSRSGSVNQMTHPVNAYNGAVAAHEAGHNFCMRHDSQGNTCPQSGLVMQAVINTGRPAPTEFSSCSQDYFDGFWNGEQYTRGYVNQASIQCLENSPTVTASDPQCGDGFVSGDEQCDCEPNCDEDPCCNGETCRYAEGAVCDKSFPCCNDQCQFTSLDANVECRPAISDCDKAEFCRGDSPECPPNVFHHAGIECKDNRGFDGLCYEGSCFSDDLVCEDAGFNGFDDAEGCDFRGCGNDISCRQSSSGRCFTLSDRIPEDGTPCFEHEDEPAQCHNNACVLSTTPELNPKWVEFKDLFTSIKSDTDVEIEFDAAYSVEFVDIHMAPFNEDGTTGEYVRVSAGVPARDGVFPWKTPKETEGLFRMRIRDSDQASILSYSAPFTISKDGSFGGDPNGGGSDGGSDSALVIGASAACAIVVVGAIGYGAVRRKRNGGSFGGGKSMFSDLKKPSFNFGRSSGGGSGKIPLTSNISSTPTSAPPAPQNSAYAPSPSRAPMPSAPMAAAAAGPARMAGSSKPLPVAPKKPLPTPGGARTGAQWETLYTDDGSPYYYNKATNETSWDRPAGM